VQSLFEADRVAYAWREIATSRLRFVLYEDGEASERACAAEEFARLGQVGIERHEAFLFDGVRGRVLSAPADGRNMPKLVQPFANLFDPPLTEGASIPIDCQAATGRIFVIRDRGASGRDLFKAVAASSALNGAFDRYHLVDVIRDSAFSKARLAMLRNIHDSVLQSLAGLGMRFGAMKLDLKAGLLEEVMGDLDKLQSLVRDEQLGLRALMREDAGAQQDDCNVIPILRELASALAEQWKIQCAVSAFPDPIMIPVALGSEVRFLVREAVANAAKHAQASWVRVSVAIEDDAIKLVITSDRNNPAESTPPSKPGEKPRSLSERVEGLGGSISLKQKKAGTHLTAFLPRKGSWRGTNIDR
jgi:signal transduction histidine kinase